MSNICRAVSIRCQAGDLRRAADLAVDVRDPSCVQVDVVIAIHRAVQFDLGVSGGDGQIGAQGRGAVDCDRLICSRRRDRRQCRRDRQVVSRHIAEGQRTSRCQGQAVQHHVGVEGRIRVACCDAQVISAGH